MTIELKWWQVRRAMKILDIIGRKLDQGATLDETDYKAWTRANDVVMYPCLALFCVLFTWMLYIIF